MKQIREITSVLLGISVVLLLMVVGGYAFKLATYHPSIYIAPPEIQNYSNVQMVREAKDIEGLRKVCAMWAEFQDRSRAYLNKQQADLSQIIEQLAIAMLLVGGIFTAGLLKIYIAVRGMERKLANAL